MDPDSITDPNPEAYFIKDLKTFTTVRILQVDTMIFSWAEIIDAGYGTFWTTFQKLNLGILKGFGSVRI